MKIKIFGERNTGTNALLEVLKLNCEQQFYPGTMAELSPLAAKKIALLQRMGLGTARKEEMIDAVFEGRSPVSWWKHSATNFSVHGLEETKFIFTVRDPKSWLVGLYKNPYHTLVGKPENLIEFSRVNWRTVKREHLCHEFYKPLELYEEKLKSYARLMEQLAKRNQQYKIIKFEDFVANQSSTFDSLKPLLKSPSRVFIELIKSTKEKDKNSEFYRWYYANEVWREEFPEVENIGCTISRDILSTFGYE